MIFVVEYRVFLWVLASTIYLIPPPIFAYLWESVGLLGNNDHGAINTAKVNPLEGFLAPLRTCEAQVKTYRFLSTSHLDQTHKFYISLENEVAGAN